MTVIKINRDEEVLRGITQVVSSYGNDGFKVIKIGKRYAIKTTRWVCASGVIDELEKLGFNKEVDVWCVPGPL